MDKAAVVCGAVGMQWSGVKRACSEVRMEPEEKGSRRGGGRAKGQD
jgi:hypothetical protein